MHREKINSFPCICASVVNLHSVSIGAAMNLSDIRQFYAEEIRAVSNLQTPGLIKGFATVPREKFLGPGPWQIVKPDAAGSNVGGLIQTSSYRTSEDADPRHIYHNVAVAIDPTRKLNNGHPSSLASMMDALNLKEGDHVVHVGAGVGYYTAIIAEAVGPSGKVTAIELDADLAARARENLAYLGQVDVIQADGGEYNPEPADVIFVNAGATRLRNAWLDALRDGGRLLLPLTMATDPGANGMGFMLSVSRTGDSYSARFHSPVMIFPCIGSRDEESNNRLRDAIRQGTWGTIQSVRRDAHEASDSCWLHGENSCLSKLPIGGTAST